MVVAVGVAAGAMVAVAIGVSVAIALATAANSGGRVGLGVAAGSPHAAISRIATAKMNAACEGCRVAWCVRAIIFRTHSGQI